MVEERWVHVQQSELPAAFYSLFEDIFLLFLYYFYLWKWREFFGLWQFFWIKIEKVLNNSVCYSVCV